MIRLALIVGLGGFLGSSARFLVQQLFLRVLPGVNVAGTFVANILGCFIIGICIEQSGRMQREWLVFLTSGFCGGFTTFSAFALENTNFMIGGNSGHAALYIGLSIVLGLLATYAGMLIAKTII
ncbi:MAG: fluoride efflux transporter CrcB [Cyclobacteriaceae bacterium]